MRDKSTQETSSVPGPDVEALKEGFDCELLAGPIKDLCWWFGLGDRVERTLSQLGCKRGPDVVTLDGNKIISVAGAGWVTYKRILLLQRYLKLWQEVKAGDTA